MTKEAAQRQFSEWVRCFEEENQLVARGLRLPGEPICVYIERRHDADFAGQLAEKETLDFFVGAIVSPLVARSVLGRRGTGWDSCGNWRCIKPM